MPLRSDWSEATCPIARSLDVVGDPWVVLVLREALTGSTRFEQFRGALGVADNVLSRRLAGDGRGGLLTRAPYDDRQPDPRGVPPHRRRRRPAAGAARARPVGGAAPARTHRADGGRARGLWPGHRQRRHLHVLRQPG